MVNRMQPALPAHTRKPAAQPKKGLHAMADHTRDPHTMLRRLQIAAVRFKHTHIHASISCAADHRQEALAWTVLSRHHRLSPWQWAPSPAAALRGLANPLCPGEGCWAQHQGRQHLCRWVWCKGGWAHGGVRKQLHGTSDQGDSSTTASLTQCILSCCLRSTSKCTPTAAGAAAVALHCCWCCQPDCLSQQLAHVYLAPSAQRHPLWSWMCPPGAALDCCPW